MRLVILLYFTTFFFNDTATTEIYTLSLHDALPISRELGAARPQQGATGLDLRREDLVLEITRSRSEEHTSELQSHVNLVCRLLLEKKNLLIAVPAFVGSLGS